MTGRGAQMGDYAIISFVGTRDGVPFEGGSSERMPLILGEDRLIPGFEENLVGQAKGEKREFDVVFPDDYQEESLRGQTAHFSVTIKDLRAKVLPEANDEFARSVGKFADMAELQGRAAQAPRGQRAGSCPPRFRRQDHRVRHGQRHGRAARRPGRPGGRGHARRAALRAGPPGDHGGGVPQGRRQDRGRAPRRVPAAGREARQDAARPVGDRQGQGRRDPPRSTSRPRSIGPGPATPATRS